MFKNVNRSISYDGFRFEESNSYIGFCSPMLPVKKDDQLIIYIWYEDSEQPVDQDLSDYITFYPVRR